MSIRLRLAHLFLSVLLGNVCKGQGSLFVNPETNKITFEKIIQADSLNSDQLFDKCKEWFLVKINQTENGITGEIRPTLLKLTFTKSYTLTLGIKEKFDHNVVIKIKDGAVKIVIDNIKAPPRPPESPKEFPLETGIVLNRMGRSGTLRGLRRLIQT